MTVTINHTTPADGTFSATGAAAWDAAHAVTGLGTLAEQNANAVAITGGAVNNTTVGATTPNTGKFTTLESTGTASLGTGSANYAQIIGGATTIPPIISAQGSDTNINMLYRTKGTGYHAFQSAAGVNNFVAVSVNSSVNYITATPATSGTAPSISSFGTDTNIPLVLQPKGTGALQAQQTDSTATGGNARGANAVDWQTIRSTAAQVASGQYSSIAGGYGNTASGSTSSIVGGFGNSSTASYSFTGAGYLNNTTGLYGVLVGGSTNSSTGYFNFIGGGFTNSGTASAAVTTQATTSVTSGSTSVTLSGSNASIKVGQYITGTGIGSDTYVAAISGTSLTLSKNASGTGTPTLSFFTPHGVVVGGGNNQATGSYSFIGGGGDAGTAGNRNVASGAWSAVVNGRNNTASGNGSFIGGGGYYDGLGATNNGNTASGDVSSVIGGIQCTASGFASITGGQSNTSTGNFSTVFNAYGNSRSIQGNHVVAGSVSPLGTFTVGNSQSATLVLARQTTDATATVLASTNTAASTGNQVIMPNNSAYLFKCTVIAGVTGAGNTSSWKLEGAIKRGANAGSTAIVGTVTTTLLAQDVGAATWAVTATADTTNGGLKITVTGQAATTIRWVCKVETTEMTY